MQEYAFKIAIYSNASTSAYNGNELVGLWFDWNTHDAKIWLRHG